jgi:hypothetical protein
MPVTLPYTFTPDTIADANQVNANFNALAAQSLGSEWMTSKDGGLESINYSGVTNYPPYLYLSYSHGTATAPSPIVNGDSLGNIWFSGQFDATPGHTAWGPIEINAVATQNWSAAGQGANLQFSATANGIGNPGTGPTAAVVMTLQRGVVVGNPTNGDMGPGTINCTGLYVNGVAVTVP